MSFRWYPVDKLAKERGESVEQVITTLGLALERQGKRMTSLNVHIDARTECLERSDRYNTRRVDELELAVTKHRYYLLLSCAFEALILAYLFIR